MSARHLGLSGQDDRDADTPTTPKPLPATATGYPVGTRHPDGVITVPLSACCGALPGDVCDCAEFAAEVAAAPVIHWPPFPLRELREAHITAAQLDGARAAAGDAARDAAGDALKPTVDQLQDSAIELFTAMIRPAVSDAA